MKSHQLGQFVWQGQIGRFQPMCLGLESDPPPPPATWEGKREGERERERNSWLFLQALFWVYDVGLLSITWWSSMQILYQKWRTLWTPETSSVISTNLLPTIPQWQPVTHIREELVNDRESKTVNLHIVVLLQSLNFVQSITLFNHQTHLFHLLDLCRSLCDRERDKYLLQWHTSYVHYTTQWCQRMTDMKAHN